MGHRERHMGGSGTLLGTSNVTGYLTHLCRKIDEELIQAQQAAYKVDGVAEDVSPPPFPWSPLTCDTGSRGSGEKEEE